MKVLFLHYAFGEDGVTRVVLNNILSIRKVDKNVKVILAAESFCSSIPKWAEKRKINWDSENLVKELERVTKDVDAIIFENPTVGLFPRRSLAFKKFAEENENRRIIYRTHDLVDDRPHLLDNFEKVADLDGVYPSTENVTFITICSSCKKVLEKKGLDKIEFIPNTISTEDWSTDNKARRLRKLFEKKGIIEKDKKVITYPVRIIPRKNIEEALLITKILRDYTLIVTLRCNKEYENKLKDLANKYDISCSIGEAYNYLGFNSNQEYTIKDLYNLSELAINTSLKEGFGYIFIEPWLANTPLIGRDLPEVTNDFKDMGINLSSLYDPSQLDLGDTTDERIKNIGKILSSPRKIEELRERLGLNKKIIRAKNGANINNEKVRKNYGDAGVAKKLLKHINQLTPIKIPA